MTFSKENLQRYSRHILLKEVGIEGQEKISKAKVLIVGLGGLGSPVASYLAAAGIGQLGLVDGDQIELSNLQRQVIHSTDLVGTSKVESAKKNINMLNPNVDVICYDYHLDELNAKNIIKSYDFVVDATDNFEVKYLINRICVALQKPFSHAGILRFEGQVLTYVPGSSCLNCVHPENKENYLIATCSEAGVLGAIAGITGTIQATEVLKYFTEVGELITNKVLMFDSLKFEFNSFKKIPNPACVVCGKLK